MLRNAMQTGAMARPPSIPTILRTEVPITNEDDCARQGFIGDDQFAQFSAELHLIWFRSPRWDTRPALV